MNTKAFAALAGAAALALTAAIPAPTHAQDAEVPDHIISEWKLGEHFSGDKVSLDELTGKVVVLEKWGVF